jgi:hypothetical protein
MNGNGELDFRAKILDSFLISTHRDLDEIIPTHSHLLEKDPIFYGHLAVWAQDNIDIRDHKELFIAFLLTSPLPQHREAGFVLIQKFPPYEVNRILSQVKEKLKKNVPRIARRAIQYYLEQREKDADWFDAAVLRQRKAMKSLYARLHIKPSSRAHAILFEDNPPEDSRLYKLREVAREENPQKQAELLVQYKVPYPIAVSIIKNLTPSVLVALIENMSAQELFMNVNALKKKGAFDHPQVKNLIEEKLGSAKKSQRVDALKAKQAAQVADVSEEVKEKMYEVTDELLKKRKIKRATALFIDKSGSMQKSMEIGKQLGALISTVAEADFFAYAFDTLAYPVECKSTKLRDWDEALKHIQAGGGTSMGCALAMMRKKKQLVEQIVIVSDGGENTSPYFISEYENYAQEQKVHPYVLLIGVWGDTDRLSPQLKTNNIPHDTIQVDPKTDYYSQPTILAFLSKPNRFEILVEIMETALPTFKDLSTEPVKSS